MADARLEQARALVAAGQFREAMGVLKDLLQANPQDGDARQLLSEVQDSMMLEIQIGEKLGKAQALADQGQRDQAEKLLGDVLKVAPNHPKALALAVALRAPAAPPPPAPGPPSVAPLDAFDPGGSAVGAPGGLGGPFDGADPVLSLDLLDSLGESPSASPVESTTMTGSEGSLAPAESARVAQYLKEGQTLFDQGHFQDAIDVWTRVFILDENNKEADALIARAKEAMSANQGEVEHHLTEAIAAYNAGDFARAKPLLEKVLQSFPGHREALYYLSRIAEAPPSPPAAAEEPPPVFAVPAATFTPAPPAASPALVGGSPDEFEFEDHLAMPTGEAMRAAAPAPAFGGFEFDSPPEAPGAGAPVQDAGVSPPPAAPSSPQAGAAPAPETFTWDDVSAADATVPLGAPAAPQVPAADLSPDAVAASRGAKTLPVQKKAPRAGGPTWLLIGGAVVGLLVVGAGIFLATKFFFGGEGPQPATVAPSKLPKPQPPRVTQPPQSSTVPAQPTPETMSPEDLLKAARAAETDQDFEKAVGLYQELLSRGGALNTEAASGLAGARASLLRQQAENERNEKFLKDYQYSVKSFREGDFGECLRVAWRLIYPDDTLARQLGKRDAVNRLIRDGYYNWAVMDLKSENVRGADKNLRDLLDFDKSDSEARRVQQFIKPYVNGSVDQNYRDVVKGLAYRPFSEN